MTLKYLPLSRYWHQHLLEQQQQSQTAVYSSSNALQVSFCDSASLSGYSRWHTQGTQMPCFLPHRRWASFASLLTEPSTCLRCSVFPVFNNFNPPGLRLLLNGSLTPPIYTKWNKDKRNFWGKHTFILSMYAQESHDLSPFIFALELWSSGQHLSSAVPSGTLLEFAESSVLCGSYYGKFSPSSCWIKLGIMHCNQKLRYTEGIRKLPQKTLPHQQKLQSVALGLTIKLQPQTRKLK